jgi:hemimethylated DNA binding protein
MRIVTKQLFRSLIRWTRRKEVRNSIFYFDKRTLLAKPELIQSTCDIFQTSVELKQAVYDSFRKNPWNADTEDAAFQVLRQLNNSLEELKLKFDLHMIHKNDMFYRHAKFRVGDIVRSIKQHPKDEVSRRIVIGWDVNVADQSQTITVFGSGSEAMSLPASSFELEMDPKFHYFPDHWWTDSFAYYDRSIRKYVPKPQLAFQYPRDYEDIVEEQLRVLALQDHSIKEHSRLAAIELHRMSDSLGKFFPAHLPVPLQEIPNLYITTHYVLDFTTQLTAQLQKAFPELKLEEIVPEDCELSQLERVAPSPPTTPVTGFAEADMVKEILFDTLWRLAVVRRQSERSLSFLEQILRQHPDLAALARPVDPPSSSSSSFSPTPSSSVEDDRELFCLTAQSFPEESSPRDFAARYRKEREDVYLLLGLLADLFRSVDSTLRRRFQSISPIFPPLHTFRMQHRHPPRPAALPRAPTKQRDQPAERSPGMQPAAGGVSGQTKTKTIFTILHDITKLAGEQSAGSFQFRVGQVVRSLLFDRLGVVVGYDPRPRDDLSQDEETIFSQKKEQQPFYSVFMDFHSSSDLNEAQGDPNYDETYSPEDTLVPVENLAEIARFRHDAISQHFYHLDRQARSFLPRPPGRYLFPQREYAIPADYPKRSILVYHLSRYPPARYMEPIIREIRLHEKIDALLFDFQLTAANFLGHTKAEAFLYEAPYHGEPDLHSWLGPDDQAARARRGIPYHRLADLLRHSPRHFTAINVYSFLTVVWAHHANPLVSAMLALGRNKLMPSHTDEVMKSARSHFQYILDHLDRDSPEAAYHLGVLAAMQGDYQRSIKLLEVAVSLLPHQLDTLLSLASSHEAVGKGKCTSLLLSLFFSSLTDWPLDTTDANLEKAVECLQRLLESFPWNRLVARRIQEIQEKIEIRQQVKRKAAAGAAGGAGEKAARRAKGSRGRERKEKSPSSPPADKTMTSADPQQPQSNEKVVDSEDSKTKGE